MMRQITIAVRCAALILTIVACAGDGPLSPGFARDVASARARWTQRGSADYTVESRVLCFCPSHMRFWSRLTVRGGAVVAAEFAEPVPSVYMESLLGWSTVEEVFSAAASASRDSIVRQLTGRFDAELGYPLEMAISCRQTALDCGVTYQMRNLRLQ
ncbi:MAG TPA: DUF6174 domain-containing protein [Gemmatimonadaceae bacterium]|nr:DUF6174 domain-containing protein [Gemmatimonadaceae bacterium]